MHTLQVDPTHHSAHRPDLHETPPEQAKLTKTSLAVLHYFKVSQDIKEQEKAYKYLIAILYKACREYRSKSGKKGLYLWSPYSEYVFQHHTHGRKENNKHWLTRDWIEEWLLNFLLPYRSYSFPDLKAAADKGAFRYIGKKCVSALLNEIKRRYPKDGVFHRVSVQLTHVYGNEDGDHKSELVDSVVGKPINLDPDHDPGDLRHCLEEHRDEFKSLGIYDVAVPLFQGVQSKLRKGEITRLVARTCNVGERQARNKISRLYETLAANKDHASVRALCNALIAENSGNVLEQEESRDTGFRRQVLSQAARDMAEFKGWAGGSPEVCKDLDRVEREQRAELRASSSLEAELSEVHKEQLRQLNDHAFFQLASSLKREVQEQANSELIPEIDGTDHVRVDLDTEVLFFEDGIEVELDTSTAEPQDGSVLCSDCQTWIEPVGDRRYASCPECGAKVAGNGDQT